MKNFSEKFKAKVDKVQAESENFLNFSNFRASKAKRNPDGSPVEGHRARNSRLFTYFKKIFPGLNEDNFENLAQIEAALQTDIGCGKGVASDQNTGIVEYSKKLEVLQQDNALKVQNRFKNIKEKELFASPGFSDFILDEKQIRADQMKKKFSDVVQSCNKDIEDFIEEKKFMDRQRKAKLSPIPDIDVLEYMKVRKNTQFQFELNFAAMKMDENRLGNKSRRGSGFPSKSFQGHSENWLRTKRRQSEVRRQGLMDSTKFDSKRGDFFQNISQRKVDTLVNDRASFREKLLANRRGSVAINAGPNLSSGIHPVGSMFGKKAGKRKGGLGHELLQSSAQGMHKFFEDEMFRGGNPFKPLITHKDHRGGIRIDMDPSLDNTKKHGVSNEISAQIFDADMSMMDRSKQIIDGLLEKTNQLEKLNKKRIRLEKKGEKGFLFNNSITNLAPDGSAVYTRDGFYETEEIMTDQNRAKAEK